jgi:hypothetical protein
MLSRLSCRWNGGDLQHVVAARRPSLGLMRCATDRAKLQKGCQLLWDIVPLYSAAWESTLE